MPDWLSLATLLTSLAAGLLVGRSLGRRPGVSLETVHKDARWAIGLVVLLLAVAASAFGVYASQTLADALPAMAQYACGPVLWTSLTAATTFLFTLCLGVAFATSHGERRALAVAVVLLIAAVQYGRWTTSRPLWPDLAENKVVDGAVLQSSPTTCAAASGANVARKLGRSMTEAEVARALGTSPLGTSDGQIIVGMARLGFDCSKSVGLDLRDVPAPAFLVVDKDSHVVALLGWTGTGPDLVDPMFGRLETTAEKLSDRWDGRAISCTVAR